MPTVAFYTLGCKVNIHETDQLRALFLREGYDEVDFNQPADVYVINSCTITSASDKKSRNIIARAYASNPEAFIAVTGCYAQRAPEQISQMNGVKLVSGVLDRAKILDFIKEAQSVNLVGDVMKAREFELLPDAKTKRTRQSLKIQDGCSRFCSYCIVPYARGPARSLPINSIKESLERIEQAHELVLTGIHLMSYGMDLTQQEDLADVVRLAASYPNIGRIRLGSLEPAMIDDSFIEKLSGIQKLCPHFHLPLQSGSDAVLSRMNRRYDTATYIEAVEKLKSTFPDCAITTDIICGFPMESKLEHNETLDFMRLAGFARVHVFPYSRRQGTKAYDMPGRIRRIEKEMRTREALSLGKELEREYLTSQIAKTLEVIPESHSEGWSEGYTQNYARARFFGESDDPTQIKIVGLSGNCLLGNRET